MKYLLLSLLLIFTGCIQPLDQTELETDHTEVSVTVVEAASIAFPGAMGFAADAQGGRGGDIYIVTNLNDSGPGSLREAVESEGPRIVVFEVSGIIELDSPLRVDNDYLTIAGQTSPGGITLKNHVLAIRADHVIVRHLRVRTGDDRVADHSDEPDAIEVRGHKVILDHVSASWAIDETLSVVRAGDVTVQNSFITESLYESSHDKGIHGYGSLIRMEHGSRYSFIQNLWAHHSGRSPRPGNYNTPDVDPLGGVSDFRNNVFYNWGGSRAGYNHDSNGAISYYNFINNAYKRGPMTSSSTVIFQERAENARGHFRGNALDGNVPGFAYGNVDYGSLTIEIQHEYAATEEFETEFTPDPITAAAAYELVLNIGGAWPRDAVDARVNQEVRDKKGPNNRTGSGAAGWINTPSEAGGYPVHEVLPAPTDTDRNGIADDWQAAWETEHGMSAEDPSIRRPDSPYTVIEEYLNWKHEQITSM
ncbi:pectate lyase family protein [Spirochaeta dissipatitropha]